LKARADWFVNLRISCAIYLRATREKMASRFAAVTSEEMIQINFLWCILSHFFSIYYPPLTSASTSVNSCLKCDMLNLNRETKLQHITKPKQNNTMELLTPAMIYCLTLFQGFKHTTLCYCYNRRRSKKAQPRKAKPFSTFAFKSFINEKKPIRIILARIC